ncbi:MATE family efflux transporter [Ahrensia sp. R2A130]|uniref:MATE family efflux transporter n=1 Tax=Ahrensia sp. R2A130 TaxID=744979 RepID=UPI0001E0947A|nr:MATE family efflux transporter [Ahrensia sp. R2A130]EFL88567.1 multi anti extrusion protein [Ahrensia sp. R2A130]
MTETATASKKPAVFTTGSTMRHVVVMTATSSVGLVSIFAVDALNLFYISLLGQQELAAAIGYAATIMFFSISLCIGIAIAAAALVGRALGAGEDERAKRMATASLVYLVLLSSLFAALLYPSLRWCLELLGARGETLEMALDFMQIVVPSIPLLGMGMVLGALLRAKGDPKRAMFVTLSGGAAALVLDPIFIFGLDMGIMGAATATVCVRAILVIVGLHGVHKVHRMLGAPHVDEIRASVAPFMTIALPAIATQLATPVGNAYVTSAIAEFGDDAVAGWAIVGRLLPVAFGVIFALSGAVGPILSQNLGAKLYDRVMATMRDALTFTLIYCLAVWALLAIANPWIVGLFGATGEAAELVRLFCLIVAGSFLFNGALFVANAAFNNLGFPFYATIFNWGRATLGVIPFVYFGKTWGSSGVMIGWGAGAVVFGIAAMVMAFRLIGTLPAREAERSVDEDRPPLPPTANSAFTSGKGAIFGINSNSGNSDSDRDRRDS